MNRPGFTAEASLYKSSKHYHIHMSMSSFEQVTAQQQSVIAQAVTRSCTNEDPTCLHGFRWEVCDDNTGQCSTGTCCTPQIPPPRCTPATVCCLPGFAAGCI